VVRAHNLRREWTGDRQEHAARPPWPAAELAPAYVLLASNDGSSITDTMIPVTGGRPML
jgi:hypothetical protein